MAASYEDFGLTPVEAAAFGKPTAALRWGGFLDTIVEGTTGVFFDEPEPQLIAEAVDRLAARPGGARGPRRPTPSTSRPERFVRADRTRWWPRSVGRWRDRDPTPSRSDRGQEAPRPRKMVAGVCQRICMSHQNDHEATYR